VAVPTVQAETEIMGNYNGGATVIMPDGTEHICRVRLWSTQERVPVPTGGTLPGLTSWGGTVDVGDSATAFGLYGTEKSRLRIDRTSRFVALELLADGIKIAGNDSIPWD
jgi:hypothetical protein